MEACEENEEAGLGDVLSGSDHLCANCQSHLSSRSSRQRLPKQVKGVNSHSLFQNVHQEDIKVVKALSRIFLPPLWDKENIDLSLEERHRPWSDDDVNCLQFCSVCTNLIGIMYLCFRELVHSSHGQSYALEKMKLYLVNSKGLVNHCRKQSKGKIKVENVSDASYSVEHREPQLEPQVSNIGIVQEQTMESEEQYEKRGDSVMKRLGKESKTWKTELNSPSRNRRKQILNKSGIFKNQTNSRRTSKSFFSKAKDITRPCGELAQEMKTDPVFGCVEEVVINEDSSHYLSEDEHDIKFEDSKMTGLQPFISEKEARFKLIEKLTTIPDSSCINKLKCNHCSDELERRYAYQHMVNCHSSEFTPSHCCNFCGVGFMSLMGLRDHATYHTDGGFACEECGRHFVSSDKMKYHVKMDHEEKEFLCNKCGETFNSSNLLCSHIERTHGWDGSGRYYMDEKERKIKCYFCVVGGCGKIFLRKEKFNEHKSSVHNLKPHHCPHIECDESYKDIRSLRLHLKKCHSMTFLSFISSDESEQDGKKSKEDKEILKAKAVESFEKARILNELTRPISERENFGTTYDPKPDSDSQRLLLKCNLCEKVGRGKGMINHLLRIHNDECGLKYLCYVCGKGCLSRHTLNGHTRRHTDVNRFPCQKCDKSFNDNRLLRSHIRSIHERPNFVCSTCGKTYSRKLRLSAHEKYYCGKKRATTRAGRRAQQLQRKLQYQQRMAQEISSVIVDSISADHPGMKSDDIAAETTIVTADPEDSNTIPVQESIVTYFTTIDYDASETKS